MRILLVDASREGWGTEQHLVTLARALAAGGHAVSVVARSGSRVEDLLRGGDVTLHASAGRGLRTTLRAIRHESPDWLVTNQSKLYWPLWLLGRLLGVRVALFRHLPQIRGWLTRCLLPLLVDRFYVVSRYAREKLIVDGAPRQRIDVLYNPIDVGEPLPDAGARAVLWTRLGIPAAAVVVGFVGRVEAKKGADLLRDALLSLMAGSSQLYALCVGDGPVIASWQVLAREKGLEARCRFIGWTSRPRDCYDVMDLLVAPSVAPETFCRVVAEAQARGVAVIASYAGGLPEAMLPGESGVLVRAGDASRLREALAALLADGARRDAYGEAGYRYVVSRFAAPRIASEFVTGLSGAGRRPLRGPTGTAARPA